MFIALFYPFINSSANATPEFEGRGGEELGTKLSNTLYKVFNNKHSIDLKGLCISAGEHCWVLYVDVLVSGSTTDWDLTCISCAVSTACILNSSQNVQYCENNVGQLLTSVPVVMWKNKTHVLCLSALCHGLHQCLPLICFHSSCSVMETYMMPFQ